MNKILITFFTILFCLTSSIGYSQNIICEKTGYGCQEIDFKELVLRNGIYYKKFSDVPFTGKVTGKQKGSLKYGKRDGSWIGYWDNGQLMYKGDWECGGKWNKNSKEEGYWVFYNKDGTINKESSGTYKFGYKMFD